MAFTPFVKSDLPSMANFNEKFREIIDETEDKVGDIKTTVRTDLGDDWLLCNGEAVDAEAYPELDAMLPEVLNNVDYIEPDMGFPEGSKEYISDNYMGYVFSENGKRICILGETPASGTSGYDWYVYHNTIGTQEWVKSTQSVYTNWGGSWSYPMFSYANGYYYICSGQAANISSGDTSATFLRVKKSADLLTWEDATITLNIQGGAYVHSSLYIGAIRYNESTKKYCIGLCTTDRKYMRLEVGETSGSGDIICTTGNMQSGDLYRSSGYTANFWACLMPIGKYFAVCEEGDSSVNSSVCYVDSSVLPGSRGSLVLPATYTYTAIPAEIDGKLVLFTTNCVFIVDIQASNKTVKMNTNLKTLRCLYFKNAYVDKDQKTVYLFYAPGSSCYIYKYVYNNLETDTAFLEEKPPAINGLSPNVNKTCVCSDGFIGVSGSDYTYRLYTSLEVSILPTITTEGAYNYIKGR